MIEDIKSQYGGERVFLIGNGPSLNRTPFDRLESEYTFGVNKINRLYDEVSWRPSFYFTSTKPSSGRFPPVHSTENPITFHVERGFQCILPDTYFDYYGERENVEYYSKCVLHNRFSPFHRMANEEIRQINIDHLLEYWSQDVSNLVYEYHCLYAAAQIAIYLGFDEICFVGTDLGLEYINPHMVFNEGKDPYRYNQGKWNYLKEAYRNRVLFKSIINAIAMKSIQSDHLNQFLNRVFSMPGLNHFDDDYRDFMIFYGPKYDSELRKSHIAINRIANHLDVDVYNATVGGELEVYPRVDIHDL